MAPSTNQSETESKYMVEGYATTYEPYVLYDDGSYRIVEIIDRNAFIGCDMSDVIFRFDHQGPVFARTKNSTLNLGPDDHGLRMAADLGKTERAKQIYEEIAQGMIEKMSWAFLVAPDGDEWEDKPGESVRRITKIAKIYDVSPVSIPANDGTEISARSIAEGVICAQHAREARRELDRTLAKVEFMIMEGKLNDLS